MEHAARRALDAHRGGRRVFEIVDRTRVHAALDLIVAAIGGGRERVVVEGECVGAAVDDVFAQDGIVDIRRRQMGEGRLICAAGHRKSTPEEAVGEAVKVECHIGDGAADDVVHTRTRGRVNGGSKQVIACGGRDAADDAVGA